MRIVAAAIGAWIGLGLLALAVGGLIGLAVKSALWVIGGQP